ncbi:hypothetical protein LEP1GSC196_2992 [Leptospira meyeri serovar Semaranga str. Veldrot Semarang 173]|nr:hypothetical protein LEP1GSC196_2992 [Leptospira meyeri serovar Semaranga str. Veldrot Semarang 173]
MAGSFFFEYSIPARSEGGELDPPPNGSPLPRGAKTCHPNSHLKKIFSKKVHTLTYIHFLSMWAPPLC